MKIKNTFIAGTIVMAACSIPAVLYSHDEDDESSNPALPLYTEEDVVELSSWEVTCSGITTGGAKDILFFRDCLTDGGIPHPQAITSEGLLSEYDLPLNSSKDAPALIQLVGEAIACELPLLPESCYLAQVGMSSSIDPATWNPDPMHYVVVLDISGSMDGEPLERSKTAIKHLIENVRPVDRFSMILFSEEAVELMAPTEVNEINKQGLIDKVAGITSEGGTCQECGLELGYSFARKLGSEFTGRGRVMLFTDERPNIGVSDADGLMVLLRKTGEEGIGTSIFGVGEHFDAELASIVSTVRGANAHFIASDEDAKRLFKEELPFITSEVAHDFKLTLRPAKGCRIAGVFGVPGDALKWEGEDALSMEIASLFLSLRKGGIFFAIAPERAVDLPARELEVGQIIATAELQYAPYGQNQEHVQQSMTFALRSAVDAGMGLTRGAILIDEYLVLKKAAALYHQDNNPGAAYELIKAFADRFEAVDDAALARERELIVYAGQSFALLSGHRGEGSISTEKLHPLCGTWLLNDEVDKKAGHLVVWPNGAMELYEEGALYEANKVTLTGTATSGELVDEEARLTLIYSIKDEVLKIGEAGDEADLMIFKKGPLPASEPDEDMVKDALTGLPERK